MRRSIPLLLALALLAAGCDRDRNSEQDRALAGRVLRGVLAYPRSSLVSVSAGNEAAELAFSSPAAVADVAQWYRQMLVLNGWEVTSDIAQADGSVSMYAQKNKQPLWLTLRPNVGGPGTSYTMVGAVVEPDSAKAK
jgi:hypothetical protein